MKSWAGIGRGAGGSEASHTATSTKTADKVATKARFKWIERISGERPTDSIPLVKPRNRNNSHALGNPRRWTGDVERCMFGAVQLRTDAFSLNFISDRDPEHDVDPGRDAGDRTDADGSSGCS